MLAISLHSFAGLLLSGDHALLAQRSRRSCGMARGLPASFAKKSMRGSTLYRVLMLDLAGGADGVPGGMMNCWIGGGVACGGLGGGVGRGGPRRRCDWGEMETRPGVEGDICATVVLQSDRTGLSADRVLDFEAAWPAWPRSVRVPTGSPVVISRAGRARQASSLAAHREINREDANILLRKR